MEVTFEFQHLPHWMEVDSNRFNRWVSGIAKDAAFECGCAAAILESKINGTTAQVKLNVGTDDLETLKCAMHNLHTGKLINYGQ